MFLLLRISMLCSPDLTWNIFTCVLMHYVQEHGDSLAFKKRKQKEKEKRVSSYNTCLQSTEMQKIWTTTQFACMFLQIPFAGIICSLSCIIHIWLHVGTHPCSISIFFPFIYGHLKLLYSACLSVQVWYWRLGFCPLGNYFFMPSFWLPLLRKDKSPKVGICPSPLCWPLLYPS